MDRVRVLIVDDEQPARMPRELCARDGRFEVVGECDGGRCGPGGRPGACADLLMLDIQMPEVDGFDVLTGLSEPLPVTIMVTAFNEHALQAFEHHALDYILKPVEVARLTVALERAVERVRQRRLAQVDAGMHSFLDALRGRGREQSRLVLRRQLDPLRRSR
ncbi:MAG: response regulator [Planctomycetota bacterium]